MNRYLTYYQFTDISRCDFNKLIRMLHKHVVLYENKKSGFGYTRLKILGPSILGANHGFFCPQIPPFIFFFFFLYFHFIEVWTICRHLNAFPSSSFLPKEDERLSVPFTRRAQSFSPCLITSI